MGAIMNDLEHLCKELEHWVTDQWAIDAILKKEILTKNVFDPCAGSGVMAETAHRAGYNVISSDIHDWGYHALSRVQDFLEIEQVLIDGDFTVFMNPPFSKAEEFIEKAFELGARKIVCFQRFAWYESNKRNQFWDKYPPNRVHVCGDRANCWRFDLPVNSKGKRYNPITGDELGSTPTAHAWFVWDVGQSGGTSLHRVYKE